MEETAMLTFTNAKVFDGGRMLPGRRNVTVDGNRIVSVSEQPAAAASTVVDLGGMTLMPGMASCHIHPDFYKYNFGHIRAGIRLGTEFPPGVMMAIAMRTCRVLLESGFTGYLGASCSNDIDAQLKIAMKEGLMQGPRIRACGHHLGATASVNDHPKWWLETRLVGQDLFADGPQEFRKLVREDIRRGAQTIKIFASGGHGFPNFEKSSRNMSRDEIAAVVAAAHERGVKVRAHVADKPMMLECLELGVDIFDHGDNIDQELADKMAKAGTYWVPSPLYLKQVLEIGRKSGVAADATMQREYDNARRMLPVAQKAGVKILAGDDYSGIFRDFFPEHDPLDHVVGNYGRELAYHAEVPGLSNADIISWATKNPGELLADGAEKVGVIEAGAVADLIVVDGDPVVDIGLLGRPEQALKAVIRDGAFIIDRLAAKQTRLAAE
jgi:imidazolonepropionase-like amidohydrolase